MQCFLWWAKFWWKWIIYTHATETSKKNSIQMKTEVLQIHFRPKIEVRRKPFVFKRKAGARRWLKIQALLANTPFCLSCFNKAKSKLLRAGNRGINFKMYPPKKALSDWQQIQVLEFGLQDWSLPLLCIHFQWSGGRSDHTSKKWKKCGVHF